MNNARLVVILLIAAGLIGSLASGAVFYTRLVAVGAILVIVSWLWVTIVARSLRLSRKPDFYRASMGDIFKEQYEIYNASRLPGLWVELDNEMPLPMAAGSRLLTRLHPREKQTYVARTWLTRRGGFPLGPTVLRISDPLGLFHAERRFEPERSLVILPMVFTIQSFLSPPGLVPGGQVTQRKTSDITPHAAGVREYVGGDPMKRIHWPTSARRGMLMVKEFEQDPQSQVWLFLDAQQKVQSEKPFERPEMPLENLLFSRRPKLSMAPSTLEYSISIAASLANYFVAERRAIALVTEDRTYTMLAPERSERQASKILETLAFLEGKGKLPVSALVNTQSSQLPQGSTVILITPSTSPDLAVVADDLQRRNLRPVFILLASESFGGQAGTQSIAGRLIEQRIPVCLIYCDADLSQALSGFASTNTSQGATSWQRPTLSHLT